MKIQFIGASREVTGSKHLITTQLGKKILLDCGSFQGKGLETDAMNRNLNFDPLSIDYIILSHAHIDHSGLIPYLYKSGYRGSVITTSATRDLCAIMLSDSGFIQENDTYNFNKKRAKKGLPPVDPIYTEEDAKKCMELFIGVPLNRKFRIDENITVKFTYNGHLLGSAVANIEINENNKLYKIAYTGDIGRYNNIILKEPEPFNHCEYLIAESTYGDRLHESNENIEDKLLKIVYETCVDKKGKLIIPSFAIGRTQQIVYLLNKFYNENKLPKINVFVDSPLAINATDIYKLHLDSFNKDVQHVLTFDHDPFGFNSLHYIKKVEDSKKLNTVNEPCIIISASGMMEAGRIKHHLANNISNNKNTILIVGYCAPTTLGAKIANGAKEVSIFGTMYNVKAKIERLDALSGHGDYNEMIKFLSCIDKNMLKKVFLVHGEYNSQLAYKKKLEEKGFQNIEIPEHLAVYDIK